MYFKSSSVRVRSLIDRSAQTFFSQWMKRFGAGKSDKWEAFSHVIVSIMDAIA